jgi:adenylate cyclase
MITTCGENRKQEREATGGMTMKKILIIDDEPDLIEVVRARLAASGYHVVTATGGVDGLQKARSIKPDLIILDVVMPGMDGGDVSQALQADPQLQPIPVVHFTSLIRREETARHNDKVPQEVFLSKTASASEMLAMIARMLPTRADA